MLCFHYFILQGHIDHNISYHPGFTLQELTNEGMYALYTKNPGKRQSRLSHLVRCFPGSVRNGPGGNRTRVRKPVRRGIFHHSCLFTFPHTGGRQQPHVLSSFIIRPLTQSLVSVVSRNHDAGYRKYGYNRADERLRPLLQLYCCQRLNLSSGFYAVRAADGFSDFKTPVETSTSPGYD